MTDVPQRPPLRTAFAAAWSWLRSAARRAAAVVKITNRAEIHRIRLEPGDIVVVRSDQVLSLGMHNFLAAEMSKAFPGHRIVLLERGFSLDIVSPTAEAAT